MNTWSTGKFQVERNWFNFPSSSVWNVLGFFSCHALYDTQNQKPLFFLVNSCGKIPRLDNDLSVDTVLLTVMKVWTVSVECIEVLLLYEISRWNGTLGEVDFPWSDGVRFSIKLSAIFPSYMPGNYILDVLSFAVSILFITVKAVMAGKLVYQEILLKGSPFYIISSWNMKKRGIVHD